jgi:hypothetical protein
LDAGNYYSLRDTGQGLNRPAKHQVLLTLPYFITYDPIYYIPNFDQSPNFINTEAGVYWKNPPPHPPSLGEWEISADVIWGKEYEDWKRIRVKM